MLLKIISEFLLFIILFYLIKNIIIKVLSKLIMNKKDY